MIWYLENYYRLDTLEAVDAVCDQSGDKGIDGIFVNENESAVEVFQAKLSQKLGRTVGDSALREFVGSLAQLQSKDALQNLIDTGGNADVVRLVKQLDLLNKVDNYEIRGVFVSNMELDDNGEAYLRTHANIRFIGKKQLENTYISDRRTAPITHNARFDITGFSVSEYIVDTSTKAIIAPVRATDLVKLAGIADQSLFAYNVRGALGRTQVNKDIIRSVRDSSTHRLFPLFHNGITVICEQVVVTGDRIAVEGYNVVNGCQSLNSLFENSRFLTDDLRVLTKFIQMNVGSPLSAQVTQYSNNQNGVKARDFKSNHPIQIRLQNEFEKIYSTEYYFEIKRGELPNGAERITNEVAGLYLMAFDLKEPWSIVRKYQVFDDKYSDLFARPEVTADRIVMLYVLMDAVERAIPSIQNTLFGKYELTRYFIIYILRSILENDSEGRRAISNPDRFVRELTSRVHFRACIERIVADIMIDVNAEVSEYGENFDYRGQLRNETWVKENAKKVASSYLKLVQRGRIRSFEQEWLNS